MSSNEVRLGDIADLNGGYAFKSGDYKDSGVFVLRTVNIKDDGSITREGATYISEEDARDYERFYLEPLDTLFVMVGATLGKTGLVQKKDLPALLNQNMWVIRTKNPEQLDALYLYYKYSIESSKILKYSTGAARDFVRRDDFRNIKFVLPRIEKQKEIAKILGDLDRKIELNRRMNETLEQIGQTLFKHYFIDNPEHEGWKETTFGEHFQLERGLSYKGMFLDEKEGVPMINLGSFNVSGEYSPRGIKYYTGEYKDKNTVKPGDLVMANTDITQQRTVLGSVLVVPDLGEEILYSHHVNAIRSKGAIPNSFIYFALKQPAFRQRAQGFATGTTVLALPKEAFTECPFYMPDEGLLSKFAVVAENLLKEKELLRKEIISLSNARDLILPKLVSGQITA